MCSRWCGSTTCQVRGAQGGLCCATGTGGAGWGLWLACRALGSLAFQLAGAGEVISAVCFAGVEGLSLDVSCLVDIRDHVNKEMALRLSTSIASEDTFFTDLNGFQIQPRRFRKKLPLQANFYPMPAMAYIQDKESRLTLHTAQALGVASLHSGQLEVILDRRLMQDDNRGLGQGLKDNKRTCNRFRLLLERRTTANKVQDSRPISFPSLLSHMTSMHLNAEVLAMPVAQEKPAPPALRSFRPLSATVPCDFHILNLRTLQAEVRAPAPWERAQHPDSSHHRHAWAGQTVRSHHPGRRRPGIRLSTQLYSLSWSPQAMLWNCSPQSQSGLWGASSPSEQTVFRARSSYGFTSWVSPGSIQHMPLRALPTASPPRRGPGGARGSCTPTSQSDVTLSQPVTQRFIR
uniref:Glycosyl hydrolase family 38 C-terminal domain-containing protein n=1 Tax=Chrysemys picta bellii TaxID=8478 RepID=A0A8C3IKL8_CHRPI